MRFMALKRKRRWDFGVHFSRHVHGMLASPKKTIKKIINEPLQQVSLTVPLSVVIISGVFSSLGIYVWPIIFDQSILSSLFKSIIFTFDIILRPLFFILYWIVLSTIIHFIAKLIKGTDLTDLKSSEKMLKLTGLSFAPYMLNIIPFLNLITGLWVFILLIWSIEFNYKIQKKYAFLAAFPAFLFWLIRIFTIIKIA